MRTPRRKFDKDFKASAVKMVLEDGLNKSEVGRRLGVNNNLVSRWVKESQSDGSEAFRGHGKLKAHDAELKRLEKENRDLRAEVEFLKKTTGYFARLKK